MAVAVHAELQGGKLPDGVLEHAGDIVVELLRKRFGVHRHDSLFRFGGIVGLLVLDKAEVRYVRIVVELQRIGVQTYESHVAGRESKIDRSEYLDEYLFARRQTVVVAQQDDIRDTQMIEDVALPLELCPHAEVGHVARMDYKIDIVPMIQSFYGIFGFIVPTLRVADDGKTHFAFSGTPRFDTDDIFGIDTFLAIDAGIVRMIFYLTAG